MNDIPLGKTTEYPSRYSPELLFPIPRRTQRETLGIAVAGDSLPFSGADLWTAWEVTWLTPSGKPASAAARIAVPADSPNMIESKSLKLYLNSLAMHRFNDETDVVGTIGRDLSAVAGTDVRIELIDAAPVSALPGSSLDLLEIECEDYEVAPRWLAADGAVTVEETLHSQLLRSLCPVTSQPDFGSVVIRYRGPRIDASGLLRYIVSFRQHCDFHEACIERMFMEIQDRCDPETLTVSARYLRRGGIDINPFRTNSGDIPDHARSWNQ